MESVEKLLKFIEGKKDNKFKGKKQPKRSKQQQLFDQTKLLGELNSELSEVSSSIKQTTHQIVQLNDSDGKNKSQKIASAEAKLKNLHKRKPALEKDIKSTFIIIKELKPDVDLHKECASMTAARALLPQPVKAKKEIQATPEPLEKPKEEVAAVKKTTEMSMFHELTKLEQKVDRKLALQSKRPDLPMFTLPTQSGPNRAKQQPVQRVQATVKPNQSIPQNYAKVAGMPWPQQQMNSTSIAQQPNHGAQVRGAVYAPPVRQQLPTMQNHPPIGRPTQNQSAPPHQQPAAVQMPDFRSIIVQNEQGFYTIQPGALQRMSQWLPSVQLDANANHCFNAPGSYSLFGHPQSSPMDELEMCFQEARKM